MKATGNESMRKGGKSVLMKVIAWLHLWPSLISAIVLIFVCLTGTIIVYGDEVMDLVNRDVLYVPYKGQKRLPSEVLLNEFKKNFPERRSPGYMVVFRDPGRSVKLNSFDPKVGLRMVYMDPYTGKVLREDKTIHFFYVTAHLHASLLWHGTGEWIIDIATIIFLIELITGLVLWWPAKWTKTTREQSFKIKWKAKFKRLNYDLHNVLGFYSLAICLVLTLTGLIIAFKPLARLTLASFGGATSPRWEKSLPAFRVGKVPFELNDIIERHFKSLPWAEAAQVLTYRMDSSGYYSIAFSRKVGLKSRDGNEPVFVDRFSGKDLKIPHKAMVQENIENGYWALHMGTWLGPVGKFITFTGGLIATSLPVTGFYIWWGRRKKSKRKNTKSRAANGGKSSLKVLPAR